MPIIGEYVISGNVSYSSPVSSSTRKALVPDEPEGVIEAVRRSWVEKLSIFLDFLSTLM